MNERGIDCRSIVAPLLTHPDTLSRRIQVNSEILESAKHKDNKIRGKTTSGEAWEIYGGRPKHSTPKREK